MGKKAQPKRAAKQRKAAASRHAAALTAWITAAQARCRHCDAHVTSQHPN
ncbi:hypothetical protein ACH4EC_11710 [Streptomyces anulatus]